MKKIKRDNGVPRIEYLRVKNYRALKNVELKDLTPVTVFLGPNGSGKSTVFDVFAFLSECFSLGLRKAWDKRGRFKEVRTRGSNGDIEFELKYREVDKPKPSRTPLVTYHLSIGEDKDGFPFVSQEWLRWKRGKQGRSAPFKFLDFQNGQGSVISGDMPDDEKGQRIQEKLDSNDLLAVNTLGQLAKNPRVSALRRFITDWHLSYLTADNTRTTPESGPQERLSESGDNLPNVIQYIKEQYPDLLDKIIDTLKSRIPRLEKVETKIMEDGRLLLQIKDAPFDNPILSKFASDGTMKMLAYLILLYGPNTPQLIGIEEPENQLHPKLLPELTEECIKTSAKTQLMITTHSPHFIDELKPEQVWVLYRNKKGYTQARKTADVKNIKEMMNEGGKLGDLWMEGFFNIEIGDPFD